MGVIWNFTVDSVLSSTFLGVETYTFVHNNFTTELRIFLFKILTKKPFDPEAKSKRIRGKSPFE